MEIVLERIMAMRESDVVATFEVAAQTFAGRHRHFDAVLERNFGTVAERFNHLELLSEDISRDLGRLIGAYFTHEYSIEAAALNDRGSSCSWETADHRSRPTQVGS